MSNRCENRIPERIVCRITCVLAILARRALEHRSTRPHSRHGKLSACVRSAWLTQLPARQLNKKEDAGGLNGPSVASDTFQVCSTPLDIPISFAGFTR